MNNQEAINILGQYDVSNIHFYTTDGEEIPFTEWSDAIEMAISALQAQDSPKPKAESVQNVQNEDLISRKAAIDAPFKKFDMDTGVTWIPLEYIEQLPSAQPEPQWIPVSERLPEKYGNYLISIHGEDEPDIGTINPNDKRGWSLCDANGFHWASDKKLIVTAWMPLPEPYRAERGTDA